MPAATSALDMLLERLDGAGPAAPVFLVSGDRVVAEPGAVRLGEALAQRVGCPAEVRRRPESLADILADLQTYSLFDPGKVIVAVETVVLAERQAAAALVDEAAEVLPFDSGGDELTGRERRAASRLFQTLRLFELDPYGTEPARLLQKLPDWVFAGAKAGGRGRRGSRKRTKPQIAKLREGFTSLLVAGREAELEGASEGAVETLADLARRGLPEGHHLVLAESSVAAEHPLVGTLERAGAYVELAQVTSGRKGFEGVEVLAAELSRQTGASIEPRATAELARRTLRKGKAFSKPGEAVQVDSSARFAAEFRKLASLAPEGRISLELVRETIADRGDEDVWAVLDAIGAGQPGEASARVSRYLEVAEDTMAARLSLWALLAGFCRHLTAIGGAIESGRVRAGESNFQRFKSAVAPKLQASLESGAANPLASLHPYRLHKAYLASGRMAARAREALPARVLEVEEQLKGGSGSPDLVLTAFVTGLAGGLATRR